MRDLEDDPRFKELLRQVEAVDVPDYPDWKRGWRWGLAAGVSAGVLIALFLLVGGKIGNFGKRLLEYGWTAAAIAFAVFLVVWAIGAFRPQNLR